VAEATLKHRILVVDDEPAVRKSVALALELEHFDVEAVENGLEALHALAERPVDAVVLDVAMPFIDGLEVCRRLRSAGNRTPILMLTARDQVDDRVSGLEAGADDYLVKPFALRELVARLRAIMRRTVEPVQEAQEQLAFGDLRLDPVEHRAYRGDALLELTRTEFLLLECFLRHPRQVLSRSQLFEMVWGYDFGSESNSLGVYIGYLRRKTEPNDEPRLIHTVRSVGYVLREDP
jgi:two-component system response regulator MprA